jgi:hypothetical protein
MKPKSSPKVTLVPTHGISPEQARDARARAWLFVFRCYESRKNPAAGQSVRGNSDGTETKEDSAYGSIIP